MAYTKSQINKIGNLLVYVASKLGGVPKTKLLKLIYIIEEEYVKRSGVPLTELSYTHLPKGPVSTFIFNQINKNRDTLKPFINLEDKYGGIWVKAASAFKDDEFSAFDLEIIDGVLDKFGGNNSQQLIDYTHRKGSLWDKINEEYAGQPPAQTHIDLTLLLDDESVDPKLRQAAKEAKSFIAYLTEKP